MKISDPLGKVYTHTMFKKKSYNIPKGGEEEYLERGRTQSEEEDDDAASDISEASDDSVSTKSSRVTRASSRARARSSSRHRGQSRQDDEAERDREDAISYASRAREDRGRQAARRASTRKTKKYGAESLGPPGTSYSLWTAQRSLKRDHKRKFNRSLCGVLLGISIVLVVLGILGIIGIAVYLGVVQKIESPNKDLISVDGAFRVVSEDFSLNLLNPLSEQYQENSQKYRESITTTYRKSYLKDSFVKVVIDGFSSGSVKVFFKVILDKTKLPGRTAEDPMTAARDVFMQEVMALEGSVFAGETIDIDSISFSLSEVQDVAGQYLAPEPYQGDQQDASKGSSLWQNLAQSTARSVQARGMEDAREQAVSESAASSWRANPGGLQEAEGPRFQEAGDRMDHQPTPASRNGWSLPRYPTQLDERRDGLLVTPRTPLIISQGGPGSYPSYPTPTAGFNQHFPTLAHSPPKLPPGPSPRLPDTFPPRDSPSPPLGRSPSPTLQKSGSDIRALMSEYMEAPPPPAKQALGQEAIFESQAPFLTQETNTLEQLFRSEKEAMGRRQTAMPSFTSQRRTSTPAPEIQRRRGAQQQASGFWGLVQGQQGQRRNSGGQKESVASLQEELDALLRLESQQQQMLASRNEIPGTKRKPGWGPGQQVAPLVTNLGSSGMKKVQPRASTPSPVTGVVDIHVPKDQDTGFFGVGSSLSFSPKPAGESMARSSTTRTQPTGPVLQGRLGQPARQQHRQQQQHRQAALLNSVPSMNSDQVIHLPAAIGDDPNIVYPQQIRAGTPMRQGPQGPIVSSPRPLSQTVRQTPLAPQTRDPDYARERPPPLPYPLQPSKPPARPQPAARRTDDTRTVRRQDLVSGLLPAAISLGSSGVSPVGIFSNLLNAYATIDSKHDITGKLIHGAASWFQGPTQESRTTDTGDQESPTPPPTSTTTSSPVRRLTTTETPIKYHPTPASTTTTTKRNKKWPTPTSTSLRVRDRIPSFSSDESEEYQSLIDRIKAANSQLSQESQYDVVTSNYDTPPPQSNAWGGTLRPKPPSEQIIQVSPAPHGYGEVEELPQLGVSNPHWYSQELGSPSSTAGYGPDDFVVETVNLDKNFFYQFFTSKPMIIDTEVVTSTSVQVDEGKVKQGRESLSGHSLQATTLPDPVQAASLLPDHLQDPSFLPQHLHRRTGEADPTPGSPPQLLNKSKFTRYHMPPEVRVRSGVVAPGESRLGKDLQGEQDT